MNFHERPVVFSCEMHPLVGIASIPERPSDRGVVIIVGGPQYRAGSHRQFVRLARGLANAGFAALRFDRRGMGDSGGEPASFEFIEADIEAAIVALMASCGALRHVVLLGLCDAASAASLYISRLDERVAGLVLLNPEVRSDQSFARAQVKHYYARRLFSRQLWSNLIAGKTDPIHSGWEAARAVLRGFTRLSSPQGGRHSADAAYHVRMAHALATFDRPVLVVLSGNDLTARTFELHTEEAREWHGLLARPSVTRRDVENADHTFSEHTARVAVERLIIEWLGTH